MEFANKLQFNDDNAYGDNGLHIDYMYLAPGGGGEAICSTSNWFAKTKTPCLGKMELEQ
jgi:hypothetical protein